MRGPLSPRIKSFAARLFSPDRITRKLRRSQQQRIAECGPGSIEERKRAIGTSSGLLALPPELRNQIWELAVALGSCYRIDLWEGFQTLQHALNVLLTCSQMSNEAQGFFQRSRDAFLRDVDFELTTPPESSLWHPWEKSWQEHLLPLYDKLDPLTDGYVAGIKFLGVTSLPMLWHDGRSERLPDCFFDAGLWHCYQVGSHDRENWVVLYLAKDDVAVRDSITPQFRQGEVQFFKLRGLWFNNNIKAAVLPGSARGEAVAREILASMGLKTLSKDIIKWVLGFQWANM